MPDNNIIPSQLESIFKNYSIGQRNKQEQFVNNLEILDTKTQKLFTPKNDLKVKIKNDYLFKVFSSININNSMVNDGNKQGVFITLTLPSKYHNLDNIEIIKEGYNQLNQTFRQIYNNFNNDGKKLSVKFVRVIEPHESFIPHLHAILYIDKQYLKHFHNHLDNILAPVSLVREGWTKFISFKSYRDNVGRFEYEIIKDVSRCSAYLLKYVKKSLKCHDNLDYYHLMNGWKTYNEIRNFTYSSGLAIPRYIFDKVCKTLKLEMGKDYNKGDNILKIIGDLIDIHQVVYDDHEAKRIDKIGLNSLYNVLIVKEKIVNESFKLIDNIMVKLKKVYYKLREFQIIRKSDNLIIYDKSRFILMR